MSEDKPKEQSMQTAELQFEVSTKKAMELLGVSDKSLERWVREGEIHVEKRKSEKGRLTNYYDQGELLAMRHGKNKKRDPDAPGGKADIVVIAKQVGQLGETLKESDKQVAQVLTTIGEQLTNMSKWHDDTIEAKNETIEAVEKQADLHRKLGEKDTKIIVLQEAINDLTTKVKELTPKKRKKWLGLFLWSLATVTLSGAIIGIAFQIGRQTVTL